MIYGKIVNGAVVERIEADADFVATLDGVWEHDAEFKMIVGHGWDGSKAIAPPAPPITPEMVDAERDRRAAEPIEFNETLFQIDPSLFEQFALATFDDEREFPRIALDNSIVTLSSDEMVELGRSVVLRKSNLAVAARLLKDKKVIPRDYADDKYW